MGERSETSRDAIGISNWDWSMRGHPHAQVRAEARIKTASKSCVCPLLVEFLEHRKTVNSDVYCETLRRLCRSIKNKRPGLLTKGVVLLHDSSRPHVSRVTRMELAKFKWETLDHPPYSPDMSPCDFYAFGSLKKHLKGKRFNSDDVLKDAVEGWVSHGHKNSGNKKLCGLFISGIVVLKPME